MIKKIGFAATAILIIVICISLLNQILTAFKAGDRLTVALDDLHKLEVKNKELKETIKQVKSIDFIETEARDKLGLSKEGDTIVVIPDEVMNKLLQDSKKEEIRLPNPQGWFKVFFN